MKQYHKIQTVYKRDPVTKHIIEGDFSLLEFEYLAENDWVFTEKVDGTNIRVMWDGEKVTFGGKTDNAQTPMDLINKLHSMFDHQVDQFRTSFGASHACLYGEGYGAGIQKGGCYRKDKSFVLFDVWVEGWWLLRDDVHDVAKTLNIDVVPIIGTGTLLDMVDVVRRGLNSQWGDFQAEGLVGRPKVELQRRNGERIIAKIKHKDFV